MNNTLYYKLIFFTDWHCGSGQAAGAELDALVIKDKNNLPYVPGRTIKGLLREQAEFLAALSPDAASAQLRIDKAFGTKKEKDKDIEAYNEAEVGELFFSNATLNLSTAKAIKQKNDHLEDYLYRTIASTAIGKDGIAKEHSLRSIQVVIPCTLYGQIDHVSDDIYPLLEQAAKMIKRLGGNRNRGLGRCKIEFIK